MLITALYLTIMILITEAGSDEDENDVSATTAAAMADIHVDVSSSKVNAVIKEMTRIQRDCPDDKMVVVSQFTSFLSIIQPLMKEQGFSFVRLDGSMSHSVRSDVVKVFQARGKLSPKVLLLSLKVSFTAFAPNLYIIIIFTLCI